MTRREVLYAPLRLAPYVSAGHAWVTGMGGVGFMVDFCHAEASEEGQCDFHRIHPAPGGGGFVRLTGCFVRLRIASLRRMCAHGI